MKEQKNISKNIRLKHSVIEIIKRVILNFDKNAEIYIFGSRVALNKKGGDIDILVVSNRINFDNKLKILANLYKDIGEQKIDLIITKDKNENSFIKYAVNTGVRII